MQSERLFGTNGIRGIINTDLTSECVMKLGVAIGTFFKGGQILVGRDGRTSSPMLVHSITGGLISTGCTIYDVGLVPTPAIQYAVKRYQMDGGIMVTASHNPPQYNGIKVIADDGIELPREYEIEIENIFYHEKFQWAEWEQVEKVHHLFGILSTYTEAIKQHVDIHTIRKKCFHVVVDPGNGVGGLTAPYLLREMGCNVTTINANVDGTFPRRSPEPKLENLIELSLAVRAVKADMGVAYDGDADRSIFVDEKGKIHWGDRTFALIEKFFLMKHPGENIVTPISSSGLIEEIAEKYSGKVVWTKVGSIIVSRMMKKIDAKLGGEENGGVFYAPHQPVRDGAMTTALILNIMAKNRRKLSELLSELPKYYIEKEELECPHELKVKVLEEFIDQIKGIIIDTIDGAKIRFQDKSSILIRPSGTEPIFRFYSEGKTRKRVVQLVKEYKTKLDEIIRKLQNRQ